MAEENQQPPAAEDQKTFPLKPIETQLLVIVQNNNQSTFAAILSMIATERLGYAVTQRTQFQLDGALKEIKIGELPEPEVPVAHTEPATPTAPETPASGAVTA